MLGIIFDSKLQWNDCIAHTIHKSNSALHWIKLIKNYFTAEELRVIITSNYYSVLYYNSELWNIPCLNFELIQKLLSASASALKVCTPTYHVRMSFIELHNISKRATPTAKYNYKHALLLYKLVNTEIPKGDWLDLNFQWKFSCRVVSFNFVKANDFKIVNYLIYNWLPVKNGKVEYGWTQGSFETYKFKWKGIFL